MIKYLITLTAAAAVLVGCEQRNVEKASKDFNQLPAAVQKTVRAQAPDAEIAGVDQKTRDGMTVYKIEFRDKERHPAMEVATDGTLMRYEAGKPAATARLAGWCGFGWRGLGLFVRCEPPNFAGHKRRSPHFGECQRKAASSMSNSVRSTGGSRGTYCVREVARLV